jgi:hypothetical protein
MMSYGSKTFRGTERFPYRSTGAFDHFVSLVVSVNSMPLEGLVESFDAAGMPGVLETGHGAPFWLLRVAGTMRNQTSGAENWNL